MPVVERWQTVPPFLVESKGFEMWLDEQVLLSEALQQAQGENNCNHAEWSMERWRERGQPQGGPLKPRETGKRIEDGVETVGLEGKMRNKTVADLSFE